MSLTQLNGKATSYHPSPLKINKDSHFIKKPPTSPPPPSSAAKPPHRQPVIIYTHSPKIIHTHPRDFMALVQKLTGQSPSDSESVPPKAKQEPPPPVADQPNKNNHHRRVAAAASDDTDSSSSVVTDENCASTRVRNVQIKSCFPPPPPATMTTAFYNHPPPINPCFSSMNIPFFPSPNSGDFYSSATLAHQPFFGNCNDSSLLLMNNNINMRSSISSSSSSSTFDGMA